MEIWQRAHIHKNLPELLRLTQVTENLLAFLMSSDTLSAEDVDQIKCAKTSSKKASRLYNVVQTRSNGYWDIIDALQKCKQSGAVQVFMKGIPEDFLKRTRVVFLGKVCGLSDLLSESEIKTLIQKLGTSLSAEEYIELCKNCFNNAEPIKLLRLEIPNRKHLYVPRFLNRRLGVNLTAFTTTSQDKYVFKGISRLELKSCIKIPDDLFIESSTKLLFGQDVNAKFIILDHQDDWKELKLKSRHPMHLIQYYEGEKEFVLLETFGSPTTIHQYLTEAKSDSQARVHENEILLKPFNYSRGLCICDSPGMGKSLLLASLAQNATESYPNSIVGFLKLSDIVSSLKDHHSFSCRETILKLLSPSQMSYILLNSILQVQNTNFELFFDALDEVPEGDQDKVTDFLQRLLEEYKNCKVYLTARKHVRTKLEKTLGVIAWDIEPLSRENQIIVLVSFWEKQCPSSLSSKLEVFASICIDRVGKMNKTDRIISGIPLQCQLLAEVYADNARVFAHPERNITEHPTLTFTSLPEMYRNLMDLRLGKSKCGLRCILNESGKYQPCDEQCAVINIHIATAFERVVPNFLKHHFIRVHNFRSLDRATILEKGLLECCVERGVEKFEFVHLTIAEYLVSLYLANMIFSGLKSKTEQLRLPEALKFVFHKLLRSDFVHHDFLPFFRDGKFSESEIFRWSADVVVYFLNHVLHVENLIFNRITDLNSLVGEMSSLILYNIILHTLRCNFLNILKLIRVYMIGFNETCKSKFKRLLKSQMFVLSGCIEILCMASLHGNLGTIKTVVNMLKETVDIDLYKWHNGEKRSERFIGLVHFVAARCECDVLEHFYQIFPNIFNEEFVYYCIYYTDILDNFHTQRRLKLLRFFDSNCNKISGDIFKSSNIFYRVHSEIIIELFRLTGCDSESTVLETAVHCAKYMSNEHFLQLRNFLFAEYKNISVFKLKGKYEEDLRKRKKDENIRCADDSEKNFAKLFEEYD